MTNITSKYKLGDYITTICTATAINVVHITLEDIQKYFQDNTQAYQCFTRKPDNSGNCFCLVMVYMKDSTTIAFNCSNTNPNILHCFRLCYQLPTIYVAPMEYKDIRKFANIVIESV